jgi:ferric-dicitrate binding protein FerR (iron transport regulator)
MKNSSPLDDLITRHFCNELNSDEQALLLQWLSASEENRQYYKALKNTWQLMKEDQTPDEINVNKEWAYFQECLEKDVREPGKKGIIRKIVVTTAIAASVLLIIGVGSTWLGHTKNNTIPVVVEESKSSTVVVRHEYNTTGKAKQLTLQDGTIIILDPLSELTYNEPFTGNRRDIILKGRAGFEVAKDKTKPFTVISGHIATTALGTKFTVTAFEQEDLITVQLYEGRVVVKPADSMHARLKDNFYLLPGEELVYSNKQNTAHVRRFIGDNIAGKNRENKEHTTPDQPSLPVGDKGSWYMFNNQPLAQVFKQLSALYGVDIVYSENDLAKMYFIGKFSKTDSVGNILKQIADLNNLTVTKQNNTYTISRP